MQVGLTVEDVNENQRLLLHKLSDLTDNNPRILLDGHFSLLTSQGGVELVPWPVFEALSPVAIFIVDTPVKLAENRLTARHGSAPRLDILLKLRKAELAHGAFVAEELGVPLRTVREDESLTDLVDMLNDLW